MSMLKPKHVLPLYKGARAVFVSGASQGPTWQNPRDQSQSGAASSSVCDDSSRSEGQPQGALSELSPTVSRGPSDSSFDRKIAPPSRSVAALGILNTSGLGRSPHTHVPVSEQLFKQGTVLPTARGAAFLPELTRQLQLTDSGSKGVAFVPKPLSSISKTGDLKAVTEPFGPGPLTSLPLSGDLTLVSDRFALKPLVSVSASDHTRPRDYSGPSEGGNRVVASQNHPEGSSLETRNLCLKQPGDGLLGTVSTLSSADGALPCKTPVSSTESVSKPRGTAYAVPSPQLGQPILPASESKGSTAALLNNVKNTVAPPLAKSRDSNSSRSFASVSSLDSSVHSRNVQDRQLSSIEYPQDPNPSSSNGASVVSTLSAKAPPWHPSPSVARTQSNRDANHVDSVDNKKKNLGYTAGGLKPITGGSEAKGKRRNHTSDAASVVGSPNRRTSFPSRKTRGLAEVRAASILPSNSQNAVRSTGPVERQAVDNLLDGVSGSVSQLYGSRKSKGKKISSSLQAHPFHAVGESRRSPSHTVVVTNICQMLKNAGMHSRASMSGSVADPLEKNEFFSAMKEWKDVITPYHACDILKQLNDPKVAMAFFNWAREQPQYKADAYVYTTMIGVMGRAKDTGAIGRLVEQMAKEGVQLSIVTYNRLIHAYGRANMIKEALEWHAQMEDVGLVPDYVTHSTLIDIYVKAGMHGKAVDAYHVMKSKGFPVDNVVHTMLMNSYGRLGELAKVMEIFKEMWVSGSAPSVVSWNTLIDIYGKAGKCSAALQFFDDMIQAGVQPDLLTYSTVIDMCGKNGYPVQAEELFSRMLDEGHTPDGIAWNTVVQIWGKAGQPRRAAKWFRRMLQAGVAPTVAAFNTLIFSFLKGGLYEEAKLVFDLMQKRMCEPSLNTYTLLLTECTTSSDQNVVNMLVDLMHASRHPVHGLIKVLLREAEVDNEQLWEDANAFWGVLLKEEGEAKRAFSDSLIMFLSKYGFHSRAGRVWQEARLRNIWPNAMRDARQSDPGLWHLNLHYMSSDTAVVATCMELMLLKNQAINNELYVFPKQLEIITGRGNRSKVRGASALKSEVVEMLALAGSPFREDPVNEGKLVARGSETRRWLMTEDLSNRLILQDGVAPRS